MKFEEINVHSSSLAAMAEVKMTSVNRQEEKNVNPGYLRKTGNR